MKPSSLAYFGDLLTSTSVLYNAALRSILLYIFRYQESASIVSKLR